MDDSTIKSKTIKGTIWKLTERILAQGVTIIVSIVLARLLEPKDYGAVSVVSIFFLFANIIISGGLNTALIQKKDADMIDYSTVLVGSVCIGVLCYCILFVFSPLIANIYKMPILIPVIRVMGITLIISAIKSIWTAYISSRLEFRKFFFATLGGTVFSAVLGISMALYGMGPWALVAQQMSNTLIDTIILIVSVKLRFRICFSLSRFKRLFNYSWKILASSIIGTTYLEIIPLVIGIKYDTSDLSIYTKGRQFPGNISSTITNTLSAVLFPVLAKVQDNENRVLRYMRLFYGLTSYIVFPLMLGFAAVSDNFIVCLLTEKWIMSAYYMRVFSFVLMFNMIHFGTSESIKAIGRSDIYLRNEIIKNICYFAVIGIFLFSTNSPTHLVLAFAVNEIIGIAVSFHTNDKFINYKYKHQILDIFPNLLISMIMAVIVYFVGTIECNSFALLGIQIILGIVVYIILSLVTRNRNFFLFLQIIKSKKLS